jgi:uncharacterized MAPEG superfamily protein
MSIELTMLCASVALLIVLVLIQANVGVMAQGLWPMAGNRDHLKEPSLWQGRTRRCVDNHREGLLMFAPLILVAHIANVTGSDLTLYGAQMFFYSRVAHAVVYLAGWPYIRPVFWTIGLVGTIMVFIALAPLLKFT